MPEPTDIWRASWHCPYCGGTVEDYTELDDVTVRLACDWTGCKMVVVIVIQEEPHA